MTNRLEDHVAVTPHPSNPMSSLSQNLWVPSGARGVFGGQILAQAIMAATATVSPKLGLHSAHCYFLLPAQKSPTIEYKVEKLSDGRSYSARLVRAWQGDSDIFVLMASYSLPPTALPANLGLAAYSAGEGKSKHSVAFSTEVPRPDLPPPEEGRVFPSFQTPFPDDVCPPSECEDDADFLEKWVQQHGDVEKPWQKKFFKEYISERRSSPVSISRGRRKAGSPEENAPYPSSRMSWLRIRDLGPEPPNVETVKAMISYISDFQFIGTAARSVGMNQNSTPRLGMLASLDHAIHFYPFPSNFDPAAPLLHVMESQSVNLSSGRGLARGRIYTWDGVLIATTGQEGVTRANVKGKQTKGAIEGGMVDVDVSKVKAKL
ncbi:acyl-CoA thioesterase II [Cryptococcus wingfieldii CBS 7118]|uniref:Acyl-CoA thioesterase II n=1 Tax=Cryptococcus wingfieldii CBS 7118 TaxID=1295528 RepID=A0A1E3IQ99_9TREE|nr:acyl-CoA thioesterase II [Cryptococcus wingfieldii CBS 7118]ODN90780.1 acyl-CoA thioesterase II [Cryptococcus wingfieldii CBS 7118]